MIVFQTRPQKLPIMELYVPEILLGLIGAMYAPSSLDLEDPSFLTITTTFSPLVSPSWRNSYSVSWEPLVESALCFLNHCVMKFIVPNYTPH